MLHLHAGFHKTGSTAIQNYLFDNDVDSRYHYFHSGIPNSSLIIKQAFKNDLANHQGFRKKNLSPKKESDIRVRARARIEKIVRDIDRPHTILSAESLGILTAEEIGQVCEYFSRYYRDMRVYIYIRPLKSRVESAFQEKLKTRYSSLEEKFPISFQKSIGSFDQIFGRDHVKVSKFSREGFPGGSVINHFLNQIGIEAELSGQSEANTSLSLPAIQLLYVYRKFFPDRHKDDDKRLQKLELLSGDPLHFHSDLFNELLIAPEGDSNWLEHRAGFSATEDIRAHDNAAIKSEQELTSIPADSIEWLRQRQPNLLSRLRFRRGNLPSIARGVRRLA